LIRLISYWNRKYEKIGVSAMAKIRVTERVNVIDYAPRALITYAEKLEKKGKKILYMNMGDPVAFDFKTPLHIKQALIDAVEKENNEYSPSEGLPEFREAITKREKQAKNVDVSPGDVLVTNGVSEGIQMVMAALVDNGDSDTYTSTERTESWKN
jgi:alanine-synthesizing transaminase